MKKKYIKIIVESLLLQVLFACVAFFFTPWFSWLHNKIYLFSIITAWLFIGSLHSTFWQLGRKDAREIAIVNNHQKSYEPKVKQKMYIGALLGLVLFVVNLVIVIAASFHFDLYEYNSATESTIFKPSPIFMIHRFLISPFMGFLPGSYGSRYVLICLVCCIVMYAPCAIAYITGAHDFSLLDRYFHKLIYKQKKEENKESEK